MNICVNSNSHIIIALMKIRAYGYKKSKMFIHHSHSVFVCAQTTTPAEVGSIEKWAQTNRMSLNFQNL